MSENNLSISEKSLNAIKDRLTKYPEPCIICQSKIPYEIGIWETPSKLNTMFGISPTTIRYYGYILCEQHSKNKDKKKIEQAILLVHASGKKVVVGKIVT